MGCYAGRLCPAQRPLEEPGCPAPKLRAAARWGRALLLNVRRCPSACKPARQVLHRSAGLSGPRGTWAVLCSLHSPRVCFPGFLSKPVHSAGLLLRTARAFVGIQTSKVCTSKVVLKKSQTEVNKSHIFKYVKFSFRLLSLHSLPAKDILILVLSSYQKLKRALDSILWEAKNKTLQSIYLE